MTVPMLNNKSRSILLPQFLNCSQTNSLHCFYKQKAIMTITGNLYKNMNRCQKIIYKNKCDTLYDSESLLTEFSNSAFSCEYSPTGKLLVVGFEQGNIRIYSPLRNDFIMENCKSHMSGVNAFTFINDTTFASCSDDKTIRIWDLRSFNEPIKILEHFDDWIKNVHYILEDKLLVASGFTKDINIYDLKSDYRHLKVTFFIDLIRSAYSNTSDAFYFSDGFSNRIHVLKNFSAYIERNCLNGSSKQILNSELIDMSEIYNNNYTNYPYSLIVHPSDWCIAVRCLDDSASTSTTIVFDNHKPDNGGSIRGKETINIDEPTISHFISESTAGREFIKEISFSHDGRIIASPFARGFRLLAFDEQVRHYQPLRYKTPKQLSVLVEQFDSKGGYVFVTKFSPCDFSLAIGTSTGNVTFCYPNL